MRTFLCAAVAIALLTITAASVGAGPEDDVYEYRHVEPLTTTPAETVQIYELLASYQRAASAKDLNSMMSLWGTDATLTIRGQTYRGKSQVRAWFANIAGSFRPRNNWVSLTPSQKTRITVQGRQATLYFESLYLDVKTRGVRSQIAADTTLVRFNEGWLIERMIATPASLVR